MNYEEAIKELDEPVDDADYGIKMMASKTTGEFILRSKYGLVKCSGDWPVPFHPKENDIKATDYKIVTETCWKDDLSKKLKQ